MSGKTPIFDSWGNKIGEFVPEGNDPIGALGCLVAALIFFGGGWIAYTTYKRIVGILIEHDIEESTAKKRVKATILLGVLVVIAILATVHAIFVAPPDWLRR